MKEKVNDNFLTKLGFKKDAMYYTYKVDEHRWLEYYPFEHRLRLYWRGIDEWENHQEETYIDFTCNSIYYTDEFNKAIELCKLENIIRI